MLARHLVNEDTTACLVPSEWFAQQPQAQLHALCAGVELFFLDAAEGRGPLWGAPSAFFALPAAADAKKAVQVLLRQPELGAALPGGSAAAEAAGSVLEVGCSDYRHDGSVLQMQLCMAMLKA